MKTNQIQLVMKYKSSCCCSHYLGIGVVDLVALSRLHLVLRCLLCRRSGFDSLDDHGRVILAGTASGCNVSRRPYQLVSQKNNVLNLS